MARTYPLTSKRVVLLMLRLIALFFLMSAITTLGYLLFPAAREANWKEIVSGPYFAGFLVNVAVVIVLFVYSDGISRILVRGLPRAQLHSRWSNVELLSIVIAGVSAYTILSAAPPFLNHLFTLLTLRNKMAQTGYENPVMVNNLISELLGSSLRLVIAIVCFLYSSKLAMLWERYQMRQIREWVRRRVV